MQLSDLLCMYYPKEYDNYYVTLITFIIAAICLVATADTQIQIFYQCNGDEITLQCTVNSTLLIWSSHEYIGGGGHNIEFGLFSAPEIGFPIYSPEDNTTFALLLMIDSLNTVIESNLFLTVSSNDSILCIDDFNAVILNATVILMPGK